MQRSLGNVCERPCQRRAKIVNVISEPAQPAQLLRAAQLRSRSFGEIQKHRRVARGERVVLSMVMEFFGRILADGMQHLIANSIASILCYEQ